MIEIGIPNEIATDILAHLIYRHGKSIHCMRYLLDMFDICGFDIPNYKICDFFVYDQDLVEEKLAILKSLVEYGYKIVEYNLYNTAIHGINKPFLEYLITLPEKHWKWGIHTNRIPFLIHRIMGSDDPQYFIGLLQKYVASKSKEELKYVLNLIPYCCNRKPIQILADYCGNIRNIPLAIQTAKMLLDHDTDFYNSNIFINLEYKINPKFLAFVESYTHQKITRQVMQDLLRIEKHMGITIPLNIIIKISTEHMSIDNPYTKAFIDRLYKKYYSTSI